MESALIALAGVLIGLLMGEYYRKRSRIEKYSNQIFEKRLKVYEGLSKEIKNASSIINALTSEDELSNEEKHDIVFHAGIKIAEYCDEHEFYLNEEISVHCGLVFVGAGHIFEEDFDKESLKNFNDGVKEAQELIRVESGVAELDGLFRSITKSRPSSELISAFNKIKKQYEKQA